MGGRSEEWPYKTVTATLSKDVKSKSGRVDYIRVQFSNENNKDSQTVEPVPNAGASALSSTVRADGFLLIPAETTMLAANTEVTVWLYD